MDKGNSLEDLLIRLSERLLSDVKSIRTSRIQDEPFVEFGETPDSITITAEFHQIKPEDLRVLVSDSMVQLTVVKDDREVFRSSYGTPKIKPKSLRMRFNNGVLEIHALKA